MRTERHPNGAVTSVALRLALFLAAGVWFLPVPAAAQVTWTSTSSGNWGTSGNWANSTAPASGGTGDLVFGLGSNVAVTATNNLASTYTASSITFNTGSFTLTGSAVTLSGSVTSTTASTHSINLNLDLGSSDRTFNVASSGNMWIRGNVAGTGGGIVKAGAGTLLLNGTNSFTGNMTVQAGMLRFGGLGTEASSNLFASGTIFLQGSGNLAFGSNQNRDVTTNIVTTGTSSGNGTLNLWNTGTQTIQGNVQVYQVVTSTGALPTTFKNATLTLGGTYATGASTSGTTRAEIRPLAAWNVVAVESSTIAPHSGITTSGTLFKTGTGTLSLGTGAILNFNNLSVETGTVAISGAGQLTSTGTYAGNVSGSTSTMFRFDSSAKVTLSGTLSGAGSLVQTGAGTLTLSSSNSYSGGTTLSAGTLEFANGGLGSTGNVTLNGGTLRWATGNTQDISARLALVSGSTATLDTNNNTVTLGSGFGGNTSASLTKAGAGTLVLNASNTYTGTTTVNSGTLQAASNALANTSSITVNGATLSAVNYNSSASLSLDSSGLATISGTGLSLGTVTNNNTTANALDFTSTSGTITLTSLSGAGNTRFRAGASIGGTVSQGSVTIDGVGSLGTVSGGTAVLNGATASITTLSGGRIDLANNVALSVQDGAFGGTIAGNGRLTKTGAGTLVLSGSNGFTGATTISAGVISFAAANALRSTSGVSIANGAGLTYTGGAGAFDRNITVTGGVGTVTNSGGNTLELAGTLTKDGTVLQLSGGAFNVTGQIVGSSSNSDLYVNGASVTLSNTNTYNGPTFVFNSGTLALGVSNAIPNNSVVTLGASGTSSATGPGTLNLGTFTDTIGGLVFSGSGNTLKMAANQTASPQLVTTGSLSLGAGTTLDLTGMGTSAGLYKLVSYTTSNTGTFATVTGLSAGYQLVYGTTELDAQQKAVLGTVTVTNPVTSIITGGSAAFTYTVANGAASGGASLLFTGSGSSNVAGSSNGSATAAGTSSSVTGLYFTGTGVGSSQTGTFDVSAPDAYGLTTATGTVSVNVLDHATSSLAATLLTSNTISLGQWNYVTNTWEKGGDTGAFSIYNLASQYGANLTADLSLVSVSGDGNGFSTDLNSFLGTIAGGTSSQFLISFDTTGLSSSGNRSTTFAISTSDKTGMSGAVASNTLYVTASVIVVPEPDTIIFAGVGIAMAGWSLWKRRRIARILQK